MGGCCSLDSLPPVPEVIKPDPDYNPISVYVRNLGMFFGRDFSIHEGVEFPKNDPQNCIWLWFNKSTGQIPNTGIIDLENFVRGTKENKDKGRVLYSAHVIEKPQYQVVQRIPSNMYSRFTGFFPGNDPEDFFYLNHPTHLAKNIHGATHIVRLYIMLDVFVL